ncbi:MAG: hypothetical protein O3C34_15730, partial [Proteobacteria bacterium]|nr:hypothetical protein [Pseudomonadota bacterium]
LELQDSPPDRSSRLIAVLTGCLQFSGGMVSTPCLLLVGLGDVRPRGEIEIHRIALRPSEISVRNKTGDGVSQSLDLPSK